MKQKFDTFQSIILKTRKKKFERLVILKEMGKTGNKQKQKNFERNHKKGNEKKTKTRTNEFSQVC